MEEYQETAWDEKFELSDGIHSVSRIQHCFQYTIKGHETITDKLPVQLCFN